MKVKISVITQTHIGTGNNLTPLDFFLQGNELVVFDLNKYLRRDLRQAERFNTEITKEAGKFSLGNFLDKTAKENKELYKYKAAITPQITTRLNSEINKNTPNKEIKEQIKDTSNKVYLPASSIKGALRTAYAYYILKNNQSLLEKLKDFILQESQRQRDSRKLAKFSDRELSRYVFYGERTSINANEEQRDIFRVISISDSDSLEPENCLEIGLTETINSSKKPINFYELIKQKTVFTAKLTINENLLNKGSLLGWNEEKRSLDTKLLCKAVNQFAQDIAEEEIKANKILEKGYTAIKSLASSGKEDSCYLCLGQGAGWSKMTVGLLLKTDKEFRTLRQKLNLASYPKERLEQEFPKTRKLLLTVKNEQLEPILPLGWVKLTFEKEEG